MRAWTLFCLGLVFAPGIAAQNPDLLVSSGREMSRADLQASLERLEAAVGSDEYGEGIREQARLRAEQIRQRLARGDFRVGDRIAVQVQGENWNAQSPGAVAPLMRVPVAGGANLPTGTGSVGATFAVQAGPSVKFPDLPVISLEGVLRSELEAYLSEQIAQYIRDPVVDAQSLIRVSVFGAVGQPGFYYPAADQNVGDVIMLAGGPAAVADYEEIAVRRGEDTLWEGDQLRSVMAEGRTLDQLNLQAGDVIEVPVRAQSSIWSTVGRYVLIIGSTVLLGIRVVG